MQVLQYRNVKGRIIFVLFTVLARSYPDLTPRFDASYRRSSNRPVAHHNIEGMSFGIYSTEEIRQMSVLKVVTPLSINKLGRALPGGIYDPALGPSLDRDVICLTCSQSSFYCPGHMGHIELPLPVVNPVFRKEIISILRSSCINCFRIQVHDVAKYLMITQMELLNAGLSVEAVDAENVVINPDPSIKDRETLGVWAQEELKKYTKKVLKRTVVEKDPSSKVTEALRRKFIDRALKSISDSKNCCYCKQRLKKLMLYQCRFIASIPSVEVAQKFIAGGNVESRESHRSKNVSMVVQPDALRDYLRKLWVEDSTFLEVVYPVLKNTDIEFPTDLFFIDVIPVIPPSMRPVSMVQDRLAEHAQSSALRNVLQRMILVQNVLKAMKDGVESLSAEGQALIQQMRGTKLTEKLSVSWEELQADVDHLLDKNLNKLTNSKNCYGLKQVVEKKEGLMRMHMMGKRVNYAARSVITPDPNLNIDEIGIPEDFAMRLTYPTPVTPWNVEELRKMIINGPKKHPGATMVENEDGSTTLLRDEAPGQRHAIAKRLLTPSGHYSGTFSGAKIVHRHLCNGDILLLNRQPTLHRPSIMGHKAHILRGEKTLRLHYANCSSYNADFDGDEMNAHFPQNEVARSEGYNIVNVSYQYLVPKNGKPLSGLIQDHVISGVKLTIRGRFFTRGEYHQLVYQALSHKSGTIHLLKPCMLKPQCLWSGKQVISTVLLNIFPQNKPPLSLEDVAKIGVKAWQSFAPQGLSTAGGTPLSGINMTESEVVIRQGELLCGVLDKKHYGATPYGLIHCVYELYGGIYSTLLLSAFAKLFTAYLQTEGFTLGVADILVLKRADKKRKNFVQQSRKIGDEIVMKALELPLDTPQEELKLRMKNFFSKDNKKYCAALDKTYKAELDKYTNEINKVCLPVGLLRKFPENNLQLMVQSGAKGSTVNTMQISCLLGQIELEGKRPPLMISGKSLPSFPPFSTSPRAGGFIDGRFMTGIKPQEFFFHCMAGREGLIDTAVKTSRSGYLQRCLIKHLEGVTVGYDQTVRDSDGSIIQYNYGEDGMDVCKAQFLDDAQLHVLNNNSNIIHSEDEIRKIQGSPDDQNALMIAKKEVNRWKKKHKVEKYRSAFVAYSEDVLETMKKVSNKLHKETGRTYRTEAMLQSWYNLDPKIQNKYQNRRRRCPDPVSARFRLDSQFGSLTEKMETLIENYKDADDMEKLRQLVYLKSMTAQCAPGEPVGILAAQSIGEPSTQMTLNTFHFAGRGDMNVTLGIPRLREVLMMASKKPKTPAMDIPFLPHVSEAKAERLRIRFTKVTVADILEKITVSESVDVGLTRQYTYKIRFFFLPRRIYKSKYPLKPASILKYMEMHFFRILENNMKKAMNLKYEYIESQNEKKPTRRKGDDENEDDEPEDQGGVTENQHMLDGEGHISSDEEAEAEDDDATMAKQRSKRTENRDYEDPEEEEIENESDMENDENGEENASTTQPEETDLFYRVELNEDPAFLDFTNRVETVKSQSVFVQRYEYDLESELWCEVILGVSLDLKKIDMSNILRETAKKAIIWQVPQINKAFLYRNAKQELVLKVDGINIMEMFKHHKYLDINRLYTNDIFAFSQVYGIECARRVLVQEVQNVFSVYGITVDPRHLLLIADYMTMDGTYRPLNRSGISDSTSPLQQMTFETALFFLKSSVLENKKDNIKSPSSCLIVGQPCRVGTGAFDLRLRVN